MPDIDILSRQLVREKNARKEAETIAENKSRVLYQANIELADKEKKTRAILNATADGIIVLNKNYEIELCNQAVCNMFDYSLDELNKKNISILLLDIANQSITEFLTSSLNLEKENINYEIDGIRKDKTNISLELSISRLQLQQDLLFICVLRNIVERKKSEQRLAVRNAVTRIIAECSTLDEAAPRILKMMCEKMKLDEGGVWKVDETNQVLRCVDTWSIENENIKTFAEISKQIPLKFGIGLPGRIWENKEPSWIKDVVLDPNFPRSKWAKKAGLHTAFAFPVLFEGKVLGILEFFKNEKYIVDANTIGMLNDISIQVGIFLERERAQKKIATLSRLAGMAEVASSILHNMGNTLNSVNTSIFMIEDKIRHSELAALAKLDKLFQKHKEDLGTYISSDLQGQHIPQFLSKLSSYWITEKKYLLDEIASLRKNVEHINNVITRQQSVTLTSGVTEKIEVAEILDDALTFYKADEYQSIKIIREYAPIQKVIIDSTKLLQIIINLIKNAIEALQESQVNNKELILRLKAEDSSHFIIQVSDNGVGILPENITKIFSQGFTTKKRGHGFGLHASAIFAIEMGGNLSVESKGLNCGTTFSLTLPIYPSHYGENVHSIVSS